MRPGRRRTARNSRQQELPFRKHGGARKGAGRKPRPERVGLMPHEARGAHEEETPVHVTVRGVRGAPNLRSQAVFGVLCQLFARSSEKGFRLVHFSVQGNHVHFIVEADDARSLSRGMQRLLSRAAMLVNAVARRSGRLWLDRHHREPIRSLSQMRNTYVYVFFNLRRHRIESGGASPATLEAHDPCTSSLWFDGWSPEHPPPGDARLIARPAIVARARTWLAASGWKRRGLIRFDEVPPPSRRGEFGLNNSE